MTVTLTPGSEKRKKKTSKDNGNAFNPQIKPALCKVMKLIVIHIAHHLLGSQKVYLDFPQYKKGWLFNLVSVHLDLSILLELIKFKRWL